MTPQHVGVIMDGSRRWARARGLKPTQGHQEGYNILLELSRYILMEKKIPYLSAYAFSTENWARTEEEVGFLMRLVTKALEDYLDEFHKDNIRILVLGSRDKLNARVVKAIEAAEQRTKDNKAGTLAICFNYGGQQEIVDAARSVVEQKIDPASLTVDTFERFLYHPGVPPLDMVIRTSGEHRLSGYMLWRASYAELIFMDKLWPEFTKADVDKALQEYSKRQRRYGS